MKLNLKTVAVIAAVSVAVNIGLGQLARKKG